MAHAERGYGPERYGQALGTSGSIAAHMLVLALVMFGLARTSRDGHTSVVPVEPLNLEFLNRPGFMTGGGAGNAGAATPPRRVEIPVQTRREITATAKPADVTPEPVVNIPVTTIQAVKLLPGSLTEIGAGDGGAGARPGAGGVGGPGSGPGEGTGLGPGRLGGFGGDVFNAGAGGVAPPVLIKEVRPAYTVDAMRAKVQGLVEMEVVVLPDGSVDPARIRITRSLDPTFGLDRQAIAAVKEWRFRPGSYRNQPVAVRVNVELTFTLR